MRGGIFGEDRFWQCRAREPPDRLQLRLSSGAGRGIASLMFAPAIRSHFMALALTALVTLACLGAVYTAWLMPDDSLGVATAPLARLQSLFDGSASVPADPPLETFLPGQRQNLTPAQAVMANLASPLARINPPPPAFNPAWLAPTDLAAATECMARAIYYEANGEPAAGQLAVAQVILNRVRHPRFPKTVCGVVNQGSDRQTGCQFTFTCDGSLSRPANLAGMARARGVASAALHGAVSYAAGQATHYHTIWIVPVWAHEMNKVAIVGHHVFYRPPGNYGGWPVFAGGKGPAAEAVLAAPVIAPAALGANGDGVTISPTIAAAPAAGRQPASPPALAVAGSAPLSTTAATGAGAGPGRATAATSPAPMFGDARRRRASLALPSQ